MLPSNGTCNLEPSQSFAERDLSQPQLRFYSHTPELPPCTLTAAPFFSMQLPLLALSSGITSHHQFSPWCWTPAVHVEPALDKGPWLAWALLTRPLSSFHTTSIYPSTQMHPHITIPSPVNTHIFPTTHFLIISIKHQDLYTNIHFHLLSHFSRTL